MIFNAVYGGKLVRCIFHYLRKDYDPNIESENTKTKTMYINNKSIEIEIRVNQNIYLQPKNEQNKYYKFKKVRIEGKTNDFIYILLDNLAISDQLFQIGIILV